MVRRVRFSPDEFEAFDPRDRRDTFDDLDDLVIDTVAGPEQAAEPNSEAPADQDDPAARPKRRSPPDDRRHLAGADWINGE